MNTECYSVKPLRFFPSHTTIVLTVYSLWLMTWKISSMFSTVTACIKYCLIFVLQLYDAIFLVYIAPIYRDMINNYTYGDNSIDMNIIYLIIMRYICYI